MTTYRIGEAGATVFNEDGKPIARLRPGYVVVEGTLDTARLSAADRPKRQRYADKKITPAEDKGAHPLRAAIKRLDQASERIQEAQREIRRR